MPYVVFGSLLLPFLEHAMEVRDEALLKRAAAFVDDAIQNARKDAMLGTLIVIEVGEWLNRFAEADVFGKLLRDSSPRIIRYVPGLAAQRAAMRGQ